MNPVKLSMIFLEKKFLSEMGIKGFYIKNIRNLDGRYQVKIMDSEEETSWIDIFQAPMSVEQLFYKWLSLGGEIC